MNILITGGCGFLGSNIAAHYLRLGSRVTVVDALFRLGGSLNADWLRGLASSHGAELRLEHLDLADAAGVERVFTERGPFDYICHLGGQVAMTTSLSDPRRDFDTNVRGTFNVLEAMRTRSPGALLVYSSTNKVYGDLGHLSYAEQDLRYTVPSLPFGMDESTPLDFASPYGCSKGAADQYVREWSRSFGLRTAVFRHSSIYGGRQFASFDQGWIGWFCGRALAQASERSAGKAPTPFTIAGTGKQVRDVLHADDLVRLYAAAYERRDSLRGAIFNIGGGMENSLSLLELFALLRRQLGLDFDLVYERTPRRLSDQDFFVADIRRAAAELGWRPQVDAATGVGRMLEWLRQSGSNTPAS